MDTLKKFFPLSFRTKDGDVASLVINILLHIVGDIIAGAIIGLLSGLPFVGWLFSLVGSLVGLYFLAGIVISLLNYFKILK